MKRVMVFGVFDGLHEGHKKFLQAARALGDHLIVVVAPDHIVEQLKGRLPAVNMRARFDALRREDGVDEVVFGDEDLGSWEIVRKHRPDVIAIGFDQQELKHDLEGHRGDFDFHSEIKVLPEYEMNK